MSFDVNFSSNQPVIKAAAGMNNDGGSGGNTGYMSQGRKKDQDGKGSLFGKENNKSDSFEISSKIPELNLEIEFETENSWIQKLLKKVKK